VSVLRCNVDDALDGTVGVLEDGGVYVSLGFRRFQGELTSDSWMHILSNDVEGLIAYFESIHAQLISLSFGE
jgi:hypothetical protein